MSQVPILLLQRYRVDRSAGATSNGAEQLVILVLKSNEGPEHAYAISKVDAMLIGHQLMAAAQDARADTRG